MKSGREPVVNPKVIGCSDKSALTMRSKKAELKNWTKKVTVEVLDRRSVSVS